MSAPDYLELARLVSANPALALSTIKASDDPTQEDAVSALASLLQPILPYLTYPALLYLASESSGLSSLLFPGTAADQAAHLSTLIDFQRDWVGSAACETRFQDDFLVDVFGPGGGAAWGAMRADCAFKLVSPAGSVELLKGEQNEGTPCESYEKFKKALHKTTGGLLAKVDFSNVVLGGGCVLGILTGQIKEHWYEGSDCDLFLYGLNPRELISKTRNIIEEIRSSLPDEHKSKLLLVKGFNAITILAPHTGKPQRVAQIIMRSNQSIFDALASFDLDACCVAFTGTAVVALPRACRSLALGNWVGGTNFLDVRLCRSRDPSGSTFGQRCVMKYQPRGFGLAISQFYINSIQLNDCDFEKVLASARQKAAKSGSVQQLKGLDALLGRMIERSRAPVRAAGSAKKVARWDMIYDDEDGDYGPAVGPGFSLKHWFSIPHGRIDVDYVRRDVWEHNVKMGDAFRSLLGNDAASFTKPRKDVQLASWNTPYVASFDTDMLLGLKTVAGPVRDWPDDVDWPDAYGYVPIVAHVQYIAKVPKSLFSIATASTATLKALCETSGPLASPAKKQRPDEPTLTTDQKSRIQLALVFLSDYRAALKPSSDHIHPPRTVVPDVTPPRSVLAPFRPVGTGVPGAATSILSPLLDLSGKPEAVAKKSETTTYQIMVESGLLMFKGLDPDIDALKDWVYQAWVITSVTATDLARRLDIAWDSLPRKELPFDVESPSILLAKMENALAELDKMIRDQAAKKASAVVCGDLGVLDADRTRWLLQFMRSDSMY